MQRRGSKGQSLPGLIVEKIRPSYLTSMLSQLPEGVVFVMGTNGKTTTTKIITELLRARGKRVITNSTGSNLTRGIISGVLQHATWEGTLPFDLAVFEVDEAYARKLAQQVRPNWVVALNVSRDQLDRFGEVDSVARLLESTIKKAKNGVITNADDPYLAAIGKATSAAGLQTDYFGAHQSLHTHFPTEKTIATVQQPDGKSPQPPTARPEPRVELTDFHKQYVTYVIDGKQYETRLNLVDPHNYLNAAAAVALVSRLLPNTPTHEHLNNLSKVRPAYGRGEIFMLQNGGGAVQLTLVKNPTSFFQALSSHAARDCDVMIAVNDNYADSRDVSWLWDVDFEPLKDKQRVITCGRRAADMALRLHYDGIPARSIPDIDEALRVFCRSQNRKVIFATYTAMLYLYETLKQRTTPQTEVAS